MAVSRLYNIAVRHQLYLEGLKEHRLDELAKVFASMEWQIRNLTAGLDVDNLDQLTQKQLRQYLKKLEKLQTTAMGKYIRGLMSFLRDYLDADRTLYNQIIADETGRDFIPLDLDVKGLMSLADKDMLSANGMTITASITALLASMVSSSRNQVNMSAANIETVTALLARLIGTKGAAYKDGLLNKLYNHAATLTRTVLQAAFTAVRDRIYRLYTTHYMWSSVMDEVTTEVCRHRNGKVYVYGKGPQPPAHYNCRSTTVPIMVRESRETPESWFDWISQQPRQLWADILPRSVYDGLRNNQLAARDLPRFDRAKPLTLAQYTGKTDIITA